MDARKYNDRNGLTSDTIAMFAILIGWWLWMPLRAFVVCLFKHFVFGGFGQQDQSYVMFLQAELFSFGTPLRPTPLFWIWLCVGLIGSLIIVLVFREGTALIVVLSLLIVGTFAGAWNGMWDADKAAARYDAQA